jgi:hypothetical protein
VNAKMVQWLSTRVDSKTRTPSPGAHPNILCIGQSYRPTKAETNPFEMSMLTHRE